VAHPQAATDIGPGQNQADVGYYGGCSDHASRQNL
jgi:hypothetical protein